MVYTVVTKLADDVQRGKMSSIGQSSVDPVKLMAASDEAFDALIEFVCQKAFISLVDKLYALPDFDSKAQFVIDVLLNEVNLKQQGVNVPSGITIQRSAFADGRPTLFCVTKHLPSGVGWQKATVTFDDAWQ